MTDWLRHAAAPPRSVARSQNQENAINNPVTTPLSAGPGVQQRASWLRPQETNAVIYRAKIWTRTADSWLCTLNPRAEIYSWSLGGRSPYVHVCACLCVCVFCCQPPTCLPPLVPNWVGGLEASTGDPIFSSGQLEICAKWSLRHLPFVIFYGPVFHGL